VHPRHHVLAAPGLILTIALSACGGSTINKSHTETDASDAAASGDDSGTTVVLGPYDGTTGKICATDSDCIGDAGVGINTCSNDYTSTVAGDTGQVLPTSVCLIPPTSANCDPAPVTDPTGALPHFCDGPDDPSSPGLCAPIDPTNPTSGQGTCLPKCTFGTNGSAAVGCAGHDACMPSIFAQTTATTAVGYGFCQGACQRDSDCSDLGTGYVCRTDSGLCTLDRPARTKAIGAACTAADYTSGACFCQFDPSTASEAGFCTTTCVVGGVACPAGWVCDPGEPSEIDFGAGASVILSGPAPGLVGVCLPSCSIPVVTTGVAVLDDAGADASYVDSSTLDASYVDVYVDSSIVDSSTVDSSSPEASVPDAGSPLVGCPANSTCQPGTVGGPDCFP
jgi:hypothetical protein